jgi:hypothetical protein
MDIVSFKFAQFSTDLCDEGNCVGRIVIQGCYQGCKKSLTSLYGR